MMLQHRLLALVGLLKTLELGDDGVFFEEGWTQVPEGCKRAGYS